MRISKIIGLALVGGLAIATSTMRSSADTTLSDGTFTSGTVTATSFGTGVTTTLPCASCGNSGAGLGVNFVFTTGALTGVGLVDSSLSYNPSTQGAIASITGSYDRALTLTNISSLPFTFRLLIEQGGIDYVTAISLGGADTGQGIFHNLSAAGLTAASFSSINLSTGAMGSAHPDFAGGPMLFGILGLSQLSTGQATGAVFDNINVTITQTPLPGALPLFVTGLGALGLLGWRRKRKAQAATA